MKECLLSEEVQEEIGRGLGLIKDTSAAREVRTLLLKFAKIMKTFLLMWIFNGHIFL